MAGYTTKLTNWKRISVAMPIILIDLLKDEAGKNYKTFSEEVRDRLLLQLKKEGKLDSPILK